MLSDFPIRAFGEVYHVGTLDAADRKDASYEGEGVSVSVHPEDWSRIARLGGPTWVLRRADGHQFQFADWHDLTPDNIAEVRAWASRRGWIAQRTVYRISWHDDEWDDTLSMDFDTEDQARAEAEFRADDEDLDTAVTEHVVWRPTATCPEVRVGRDCDPTDALLAAFIRAARPDLDGVWWDDTHDVLRLSAPRGVLVHDLARYTRQEA